jgi:hypothetical protein
MLLGSTTTGGRAHLCEIDEVPNHMHSSNNLSESIEIDTDTAVIVCAGPSLDRLSATAWNKIRKAGAIVAVNGAFTARACNENNVMFSQVAAMTSGEHMEEIVPGFLKKWNTTRA